MKIRLVYDEDLSLFQEMFYEFGEVELLKTPDKNIDLLIFPGGADINPARYGHKDNFKGSYQDKRDEFELKVFNKAMTTDNYAKKVLGICRGMQLINVGMGGTLIQDIEARFGEPHQFSHSLRINNESIFDENLKIVNSLHHQAIQTTGGCYLNPCLLSVEPNTRTSEMVLWGNSVLGMQFHPEYFKGSLLGHKKAIASKIIAWVNDEVEIKTSSTAKPKERYTVFPDINTAMKSLEFSFSEYEQALKKIKE